MQVSSRKAISTGVAAAIIVVVLVVISAGAYLVLQPGTGGSGTTTPTSKSSISTTATQTFSPLTIQAGGSSFVNPVMQIWIVGFNQFSNNAVQVNYQPLGSGAGISGVQKGTWSFAGSDAPHANQTAAGGTLLNIPESLGAVAIFYNIPGVTVSLNLTGPIIAKMYLQQITKWNDPSITALNPRLSGQLLNHTIVPVHRSDGSGTTYAITNYFTKVSSDWNASGKGFGTSVNWPASGELAGKGSSGVAAYVQQTPYSVGYADSYYAFSNKLLSAAVQNPAGVFLVPSLAGVTAAAAAFSTQLQADPTFSITNAPGATSYPISTFTYILVWQKQSNQGLGYDMAQFFLWIVTSGQSYGPSLYYPQLPPSMVAIDRGLIAQMNYNGVPFISG
jgi:phosphate transport system substrate-binding protein